MTISVEQPETGWNCINSFLQPKYRKLLRIHRKRPQLFRVGKQLSLLACFAVCLCAAAYMNNLVEEIIDESISSESDLQGISLQENSRKSRLLRIVLENRGLDSKQFWDPFDMMDAIKMAGDIKKEELSAAEISLEQAKQFDVDSFPDTILYRQLVSVGDVDHSHGSSRSYRTVGGARSMVFDHEAEFIERVDDNKDSLWLLHVIAVDSDRRTERTDRDSDFNSGSTEDHLWGRLVNRYHPFGFKMGLLNCHSLRSICIDRGFMAADLILALPRGGDRVKDSVQFRPYPRLFRPRDNQHKRASTKWSTDETLQAIHIWLLSLLGERVRRPRSIDDILPGSMTFLGSTHEPYKFQMQWLSWSRRRPQPLHLIWIPSGHQSLQFDYNLPPLSLSALSVPYTGRVRFWILNPSQLHKGLFTQLSQGYDAYTFNDLFATLGCPGNSTYLLISPEAGCYNFGSLKGEYLGYRTLGMFLRFFYPSTDDCLLCASAVVNLLVVLNSGITAGILFARLTATHTRPSRPNGSLSTRRRLALTLMHLARRGWISHTLPNGSDQSAATSTGQIVGSRRRDTHMEHDYSVHSPLVYTPTSSTICLNFVIELSKSILRNIISVNLLLLLTVLPLINLLSLPSLSLLINICLTFIRSFASMPLTVTMRLALVSGKMNWTIFLSLGFIFWLFLAILSAYVQRIFFVLHRSSYLSSTHSRRTSTRRISSSFVRRLNSAPPNNFWDELSRLLLTSDADTFTDRATNTSTSSSSEADSVSTQLAGNRLDDTELEAVSTSNEHPERNRLLRRLRRLHQFLHNDSNYLNSLPSRPTPSNMDFQNPNGSESEFHINQRVSSAHIFTWKCSNKRVQVTRKPTEDIPESIRSGEKIDLTDISDIEHHNQSQRLLDAGYEAEDEQDNSGVVIAKQRGQLRFRRPCFRRPTLPFPRSSYSNSSTSLPESNSEPEYVPPYDNRQLHSNEPNQTEVLNWPLWVIPCKDCVVCWRAFRPGVRLGALPCGHGFHEACIRRWLDTGALDCPVCRWPAYAPHLRQQRQMIGQLLHAVNTNIDDVDNQRGL